MSQAGIVNRASGPVPPEVATEYDGNTGTAVPVANVLNVVGSGGIDVTASGNTLTISDTNDVSWSVVTDATATLVVNRGVIGNRGTAQTFTLPITAAVGDVIEVARKGAGAITIDYGTGQYIVFGVSTSTTTSGTIVTATAAATVRLLCTVADTEFQVLSSQGSWTVT